MMVSGLTFAWYPTGAAPIPGAVAGEAAGRSSNLRRNLLSVSRGARYSARERGLPDVLQAVADHAHQPDR